eukprot:TRINITY_DN15493_c0_g1_i1.p1 TRINITY_DN15493_c0_g1~~TRINITY_DN15493_c0_g1_i1.p1  ORF type:complete len:410 (+),score=85.73 TRINITY_DN15493_c0_g1_i1:90-1319(+)
MEAHVNGIDEGEHSHSLREELEKMGSMINDDGMIAEEDSMILSFTMLEGGTEGIEAEVDYHHHHHQSTLHQPHQAPFSSESFSETYRNETETETEANTEEEGEFQSPDAQLNSWKDLRLPLFNEETVNSTILRLEEDCKKLEAELDQLLQTSKTTLTWKSEETVSQDQATTLKYKATRLEAELEDIQNKNGALSVDLAPDVIRMTTWRDLANSVSQLDEIVSFLEQRIETVRSQVDEQNKINEEMAELHKSLEEQLRTLKDLKESTPKGKGKGKSKVKSNSKTKLNTGDKEEKDDVVSDLRQVSRLLGGIIESYYPIPMEQRPKKRGRKAKEKETGSETGIKDNIEYVTLNEYLRDLLHLWANKEGDEQYLELEDQYHPKFTQLLLKTCIVEVHPVDKKKIKVAISQND